MARCSLMTAAGGKSRGLHIPPTRNRATNLCFLLKNCSGGGRLFFSRFVIYYLRRCTPRFGSLEWSEWTLDRRVLLRTGGVSNAEKYDRMLYRVCNYFSPPGRYCVMRFGSCCAVLALRDWLICISGCSTQWRGWRRWKNLCGVKALGECR